MDRRSIENKPLKQHLESMRKQLSEDRMRWIPGWRELSENIVPECGIYTFSEAAAHNADSDRSKILDGYPYRVARDFASGMQSVATPKSRPWFRTGTYDVEMMEYRPIKEWLKIVDDVLRYMFSQSNFYSVLPSVYLELGVFGTACCGAFSSFDSPVFYRPFTVGEYMVARDNEGKVDTVIREYHMTARQMREEFGEDRLSFKVKTALHAGRGNEWHQVVHAVYPRESWGKSPFAGDKRFASVYYEPDSGADRILRESGFDEFPYLVPTSNRIATRAYGHGLGGVALPDIKSLYHLKGKTLLGVDKSVDPPVVTSGTNKDGIINTMPGGFSYENGSVHGPEGGIRAMYEVRPDLAAAWASIQDLREQIGSAFYHDLFLMMAGTDRREITAREVAERHEEKLLMLSPLSEAVHTDMLDPAIDINFHRALNAGMIPPPPPELQGEKLRIEYIDILTQAQKMVGITSIEQLAGFVGNLSGVFPEARHKFNVKEAIDDYANRLGVVPSIIRTDDEASEMSAAEQKQQQMQQMMDNAGQLAQGAKVMSETDMGGNNALTALTGAQS